MYFFVGWFTDGFVTPFVIIILLLAADFWMVKVRRLCDERDISPQRLLVQNLSGRLLVGLRWWNRIKEDGSSEWVYECHPNADKRVPAMNSRIFWGGLYAAMIAWIAAGLLALLTFDVQWLLVCITAVSLTGANVTGYTRCSQQAANGTPAATGLGGLNSGSLAGAASFAALPGVLPAITNSISNSLFGSTQAQAGSTAAAPQGQTGGAQQKPAAGGLQGDVTGETVV